MEALRERGEICHDRSAEEDCALRLLDERVLEEAASLEALVDEVAQVR
jgi:hypothetical protein